MNYIIFHVPHSSLKIPKVFNDICIKDKEYINKTNLFLCDYNTDKLLPNKCHKLIFKYSRIFCDVEKFLDDKKESMSKKGMGVIYTKDTHNTITNPSNKYKNKIIKSYYKPHHNKLDKIVTNALNKYNKCIIIDLHSFSDEMVSTLFNNKNTPDICIGVNNIYNKQLLDITIDHFKKYNYKIDINNPYEGSIIPNKYINKNNDNLLSIMIEINKRIYLNSDEFYKLKDCIDTYYKKIMIDFSF